MTKHRAGHSRIDFLDKGIVAPLTQYTAPAHDPETGRMIPGSFDGGVYQANGIHFPAGANAYITHKNIAPDQIDPDRATHLPGTWLYLGMIQNNHFGHFISESIARLWGADEVPGFDGFIYIKRFPNQPLRPHVDRVLDVLLPGRQMAHADRLTQVDKLIVPQAIRFPQGFISGHPRVQSFFGKRIERLMQENSSPAYEKIYVSRAAMPRDAPVARLLLEDIIESNLRAEGYQIIYPEQLSFPDQLRLYTNAEKLIFSEGSAFHVYVLAAKSSQKIYNVWRRKVMHPVFGKQISSFEGPALEGTSHVREMYTRRDAPTVLARALSVVDIAALGRELMQAGFIDGTHWRVPDDSEVASAKNEVRDVYDIDTPR